MEHKISTQDLKISFDNKVVYEPLPQQTRFHTSPAKYRLLGGSAGGGKRISLYTNVFTDSGWKLAKDISYSDMLLAPSGEFAKILGIYYGHDRPTYRMSFADGRSVDVDSEHLWRVYSGKHGKRDGWVVRTTEEMFNARGGWSVPLVDKVPGLSWIGPDPYICGLILGDGTLTGNYTTVYTIEPEIMAYLSERGWRIYDYNYQNTTMCQFFKEDFRNVLGRISGVNKRVPESLLMADPDTRLAVLQGLMDTDGHHDKPPKGGAGFTNKSEQLCKDVVYIARSLGGKATIRLVRRPGRSVRGYKAGDEYYKVNISHCGKFNPFRLRRKAERVNQKQLGGNSLAIKSIKRVENSDGVCFTVDHPSHLYVIQDFIVTHNSLAIMAEAVLRSIKYSFPLTGAVFRRSFPELESTIIRGIQSMLPNWFYKYNQAQHVLTMKNGSLIEFCYAESDSDVIRYQSREWDWLGIDELTHFSEFQWSYLMSRVRTTKPINTKFFAGTNPGGRGHSWVRDRWVTKTCTDPEYKKDEYDFIPAGVYDNPYLMENNPDYIAQLKSLPEKERKALLEGNWDIFEGAFFTEWDYSTHVVEDFDVPETWRLIMGWDDGTREPRAVYVCAIDNDQKVWCIWEYYKAGENLAQAAENIKRELQDNGMWGRIYKCVVDPSMKRVDSQTGLSSVEVLEGMGFGFRIGNVELGNNDRVEGWRLFKTYLSHKPYEEPMWKCTKSCSNIIRTIPQLIYYQPRSGSGSKREDLDTTQEDHCISGSTLVDLPTGQVPIKDLVGTTGEVISIGGVYKYHDVKKTGRERLYKVVFEDGSEIKATGEHPILMSDFNWKSVQYLRPQDEVIDNRSKRLIQSGTHGGKGNKQHNPGVRWRAILQVFHLFSEAWDKVAQSCVGVPLWKDSGWLSYTSHGWGFSEQSDFESQKDERGRAPFLSFKEYERRNARQNSQTSRGDNRGFEEVARIKGWEKVAQYPFEGAMEQKGVRIEDLRVLWRDLCYKNFWGLKVLWSKLQSQSKTKKVKEVVQCGIEDVYNMNVNNVNCFSVEGGVIAHNSADAVRYLLMSLDRLPSRFESGSAIEVKKRQYTPIPRY